jgi:hypothetical protein
MGGPKASLDVVEKRKALPLQGFEPGHPTHSALLFQLNYPDFLITGLELCKFSCPMLL